MMLYRTSIRLSRHAVYMLTLHPTRSMAVHAETMTTSPPVHFYRRPLPSTCIPFSSSEGKKVFQESLLSGHMEGYFGLAAQFRTQDEPAFCGLSTLVMVLNTLEVDPKRVWKGVWRWYHENMLDCCVPLNTAEQTGITLDQFACLASCNTLTVETHRAMGQETEEKFRDAVIQVTRRDDVIMVAGYSRSVLDQTGSGHFSPIAGYHPERDLVLILDTARFKYPPHWVSLSLLWKSLQADDPDTGMPRGYILLSKSGRAPLVMFRLAEALSLSLQGGEDGGQVISSSMQLFLDTWQEWLSQKPCHEENILKSALVIFTRALSKLDENEVLLTTQLSVTCPNDISNEHSCVVRELLKSLESMSLYSMAMKYLGEHSDIHTAKAGNAAGNLPACCQTLQAAACEVNDKPNCPYFNITPAHFITLLLLAWPHRRCDNTNGLALRRRAVTLMSQAHLSLQNEVAQLNRQLDSISTYLRTCQGSSVCCCTNNDH